MPYLRFVYDGSRRHIHKIPLSFSVREYGSGSSYILGKWSTSTMDNWKLQLINLKPLGEARCPHKLYAPISVILPEIDETVLYP